jgi:hypothetical protein
MIKLALFDLIISKCENYEMKIAKNLLFITGLFPICVGGFYYISSLNSSIPMIERHVANTNLIAVGFLTILLALQMEYDEFRLASLYTGIFLLLWSGGNDFYILMRNAFFPESTFFVFPFPIFPLTLGSISLFMQSYYLSDQHKIHKKISRATLIFGLILIFSITVFQIRKDKANYLYKIEHTSGR